MLSCVGGSVVQLIIASVLLIHRGRWEDRAALGFGVGQVGSLERIISRVQLSFMDNCSLWGRRFGMLPFSWNPG